MAQRQDFLKNTHHMMMLACTCCCCCCCIEAETLGYPVDQL